VVISVIVILIIVLAAHGLKGSDKPVTNKTHPSTPVTPVVPKVTPKVVPKVKPQPSCTPKAEPPWKVEETCSFSIDRFIKGQDIDINSDDFKCHLDNYGLY
jgi:hypothetical protein